MQETGTLICWPTDSAESVSLDSGTDPTEAAETEADTGGAETEAEGGAGEPEVQD